MNGLPACPICQLLLGSFGGRLSVCENLFMSANITAISSVLFNILTNHLSITRFKGPVTLPCGHNGCSDCIQAMVQQTAAGGSASCPLCRATFPATTPLSLNHELQELLTMAAAVGTLEAQDGWQAVGLDHQHPNEKLNDEQASTSTSNSAPEALEELVLFAPVPTAPPYSSAESTSEATSPRLAADGRRSSIEIIPPHTNPPFIAPRRFDVATLTATGGSIADALDLEPPVWLPDSAADVCMGSSCGKAFSLVTPRHHCRLCGRYNTTPLETPFFNTEFNNLAIILTFLPPFLCTFHQEMLFAAGAVKTG